MRSSSNLNKNPSAEPDESDPEIRTCAHDLIVTPRSPVEESFYESYLIQSRTAVDNLYASNVLACQKHAKEVQHLARQRKVKLSSLERERKKLVKSMEALKLKQEVVKLTKPTPSPSNKLNCKGITRGETGGGIAVTEHESGSLSPLTTSSKTMDTENAGDGSEEVQSSVRLDITGNVSSSSCKDLRVLHEDHSTNPDSIFTLPAIPNNLRPTSSLANVSLLDSHLVTQLSQEVPNDPQANKHLISLKSKTARSQSTSKKSTNWDKKQFKSEISTKVKWFPRS